ncbi:SRPBCC family protein [Rhodococcoides yunnanense]|uniref:SRPBCC family protein n=1 Tax=Rhodococcoides yunnanense TaxID=278209 RepID=A0ABU4BII1_9NOCA|nr:SRPBCC family protein [Rhodococcus yunnanensis]MDV6264017.1 SRPBCC family protein [Rhodococcus yunnanensis]
MTDSSALAGEVSVIATARPGRVWDVITGCGGAGPIGAHWKDGTSGPVVGVRFRRDVEREGGCPIYWKHLTITINEPPRVFAFTVDLPWRAGATWRYDVEPTDAGTTITESYSLADT